MRLVYRGPDVPERLLFEHEEGRVVFFCGAGVSMKAGMPSFRGLVQKLYQELDGTPGPSRDRSDEWQAFEAAQYDTVIAILEKRRSNHGQSDGRLEVREKLADILAVNESHSGESLETHSSLLRLSRDRSGVTRLVTTNFDRFFIKAMQEELALETPVLAAPHLPIPKEGRWDALVHLHGMLPEDRNMTALNELVVSSGDFGRAYLTERWASRFLTGLFQKYTVCFVGYSIDDPVLRYITDALYVDGDLGEEINRPYAFVSTQMRDCIPPEWNQKNVIPIPYTERSEEEGLPPHGLLHDTLGKWSENYRDGTGAKRAVIAKYAGQKPGSRLYREEARKSVMWALMDENAARAFAEQDPPYDFEWVETLGEAVLGYNDLPIFGVSPDRHHRDDMKFSLLARPTANVEPSGFTHAYWMTPFAREETHGQLDVRMRVICQWLARYVDDPRLVLWIARHGARLGSDFKEIVRRRLKQQRGDGTVFDALSPALRTVWDWMLGDRVVHARRSEHHAYYLWYDWESDFKMKGMTPELRKQLRRLLEPCVKLSEPMHIAWPEEEDAESSDRPERVGDLFSVDFTTYGAVTEQMIIKLRSKQPWRDALPDMLPDFTLLLRDMLDMQRLAGRAGDDYDFSYMDRPSISDHSQNRDWSDNETLIVLVRDAMLASARMNVAAARLMIDQWWLQPYPVFKRLVFFCCTVEGLVPEHKAVRFLLDQNARWLWSIYVRREAIQLLASLTPKLSDRNLKRLVGAVLAGPPRDHFRKDVSDKEFQLEVDRAIWLRLAKMRKAGARLNAEAVTRLQKLGRQHSWKLVPDDRDEFPSYFMDHDQIQAEKVRHTIPRDLEGMAAYLRNHPRAGDHLFDEDGWGRSSDDWEDVCREAGQTAFAALRKIGFQSEYAQRWETALRVWFDANRELVKADRQSTKTSSPEADTTEQPASPVAGMEPSPTWPEIIQVVRGAQDDFIRRLAHDLSGGMRDLTAQFNDRHDLFFAFCDQMLSLEHREYSIDGMDIYGEAINHPVGHITEAMMRWWYDQRPKQGMKLPREFSNRLEKIIGGSDSGMMCGKAIMGWHSSNLFVVDDAWTKQHALPLFDWSDRESAKAIWQGFLHSNSLAFDMLQEMKRSLVTTGCNHLDKLGEVRKKFAQCIAIIAMEGGCVIPDNDLRSILKKFDTVDLRECIDTVTRLLEGAGDQRNEYWKNRAEPFVVMLTAIDSSPDDDLAHGYARLLTRSGNAFPTAGDRLKHRLTRLRRPHRLLIYLQDNDLAQYDAEKFLDFLDRIIDTDMQWPTDDMKEHLLSCLDRISGWHDSLRHDPRMSKLRKFSEGN